MSITKDVAVRLSLNGADNVKAQLTGVTEQADKLKTKTATLTIDANDDDFMVQAAQVLAQAKELGATKVKIAVDASTANAKTAMDLINAEADKLGLKKVTIKVNVDDSEAKSARDLSGIGGAASALSGVGDLFGAVDQEASGAAKGIALFNVATGILEPELAGLVVATGGLAAGFLSAGAGAAVFGKVATAVWASVSSNIKAATKASEQMSTAATPQQFAAASKAFEASLKGLGPAQKQIVIGASNAESGWASFVHSATAGVATVLVPALGLVPKALQLIAPFLAPVEKALRGIVSMVSSGLSSGGMKSFIADLSGNAGPAITKVAAAIKNVVVGIGGILKAFMPVSQGMLSGLDKITGKFASWGSGLTGGSGFKDLMNMFKQDTPLATAALKNLIGILKTVGGQMTGMDTFGNSKMFLQMAVAVSGLVNSLLKAHPELVWLVLYLKLGGDAVGKLRTAFTSLGAGITGIKDLTKNVGNLRSGLKDSEAAASDATGAWGTFGGKISGIGGSLKTAVTAVKEWSIWSKIAGAATKVWTGIQIAFDAVMDANPIVIIVIAVIALIAVIVLLAVKFKPVRDFFKQAWHDIVQWTIDAWHGIVSAFNAIVHAVSAAVSVVIDFVKAHWALIVGIFLGPIALVVALIIQHWAQIKAITVKLISDVVGFFKALPGRILSALGNLGKLLLNAGKDLVNGLINGIENAAGHLLSIVTGLGSKVSGAFKSVLGIFSPSRVFIEHGKNIVMGLVTGIGNNTGIATSAATQLGRSVSNVARSSLSSGGAGGGAVNVQIGGGSGDQLITAIVTELRSNIRVNFGGNVQRWATGR